MKKLDNVRLADPTAERMRASHAQAIQEMQSLPAMGLRVIKDVTVVNNNSVMVSHGLGRAPQWVGVSAVRWDGAAFIDSGTVFDRGTTDANGNPIDRTKFLVFAAHDFTSAGSITLTFDVLVL